MGLLFVSFSLLVIISAGFMFWGINSQKEDALVINLAGRQRMLTQKMIWLALVQADNPEFATSIELFDRTLHALREGGTTIDATGNVVLLPPAPDATLRAQLGEAVQTWGDFRAHLQPVNLPALLNEGPLILTQLDAVVSAFEARAEAKVFRLQMIQLAFLVTTSLLLAWVYLQTRRRIVDPLTELGKAAQRIGEGNLNAHVPAMGADELGELARAFEIMRAELAASRASLEARVAQLTRELITAFEFSQEIVAQLEPEDLFRSVVDRARALTQAQTAFLCLLMQDGEYLEMVASSGDTQVPPELKQAAGRGFTKQVIGAGRTVVSETECVDCAYLGAHDPGLCAVAPLGVGDRTIGAMCVVRTEKYTAGEVTPFDPGGQRALTLLANSAAIAITNARLVEAKRQEAERSAALSEREQLAADLHDNLAQTLSFLRIKLEWVEELLAGDQVAAAGDELAHMDAAIASAYRQVRAALMGLSQPQPGIGNFAEKLTASVDDFRAASGLPVDLTIVNSSALILPFVTQTQILHVVREALANTLQHAQASQVWVRVERLNGQARFIVEDNGVGFDPQWQIGQSHLGLRIMRTRVERSGGELTLASAIGAGTKIVASFPLLESQNSKLRIAGRSK